MKMTKGFNMKPSKRTGQKFGWWKVLGRGPTEGTNSTLIVQCKCGTIAKTQLGGLLYGRSTKCLSCAKRTRGANIRRGALGLIRDNQKLVLVHEGRLLHPKNKWMCLDCGYTRVSEQPPRGCRECCPCGPKNQQMVDWPNGERLTVSTSAEKLGLSRYALYLRLQKFKKGDPRIFLPKKT